VSNHRYDLQGDWGPSFSRNSRGIVTVNGQTQKTAVHLMGLGADDKEHQDMSAFFCPLFEATVREVCREVAAMRAAGTLRPFTEGEPVGALPRRVRLKPPTPARLKREHDQRMQDRQREMLALRRRNDANIEALLRRPATDAPTLTREAP
jgi:hypothetical protein